MQSVVRYPKTEALTKAVEPPDTYVKQYRVRLDPRANVGREQQLSITITGADAPGMALLIAPSDIK